MYSTNNKRVKRYPDEMQEVTVDSENLLLDAGIAGDCCGFMSHTDVEKQIKFPGHTKKDIKHFFTSKMKDHFKDMSPLLAGTDVFGVGGQTENIVMNDGITVDCPGVMNYASFEERLELSVPTMKAVKDLLIPKNHSGVISQLLVGRDVLGVGRDIFAKRLAFLIPAVEFIHEVAKPGAEIGPTVIVLCPTRLSAKQTHCVANIIMEHHPYTVGLAIYKDKNWVSAEMLVATPDWLVHHLLKNEDLLTENLKCLIIDDADKILEAHFVREMVMMDHILPKAGRQTAIFSSMLTIEVMNLASLFCEETPLCFDMHDSKNMDAKEKLQLCYCCVPGQQRFPLLCSFLKKNQSKKVMIVLSSCNSVKFHAELLRNFNIGCLNIEGEQYERSSTFLEFWNSKKGFLLCTDADAQGQNVPLVDWIVQYDPPNLLEEFMCRAIANREVGSLIFLDQDEEKHFSQYLRAENVPADPYNIAATKEELSSLYDNQKELVMKPNSTLYKYAEDAFRSYIRAHQLPGMENLTPHEQEAIAARLGLVPCPAHLISSRNDLFLLRKVEPAPYIK